MIEHNAGLGQARCPYCKCLLNVVDEHGLGCPWLGIQPRVMPSPEQQVGSQERLNGMAAAYNARVTPLNDAVWSFMV